MRFVGELGVNGDRHVGNALAQQLLANPFATVDGVVVGIARHRKQPTRMGQNAHTVIGGHFVDALRGPIGDGECFGVVLFDLVDVSRVSLNRDRLEDDWIVGSSTLQFEEGVRLSAVEVRIVREHENLVGGQKLAENVFILPYHPPNQLVGVVDEELYVEARVTVEFDPAAKRGKQPTQRCLVLEHLLGGMVAEVFAEELDEPWFVDGLVVENADDLFANLFHSGELVFLGRLEQGGVGLPVGKGEGNSPGDVEWSHHPPAVSCRLDPINQSRGA